MAIKLVVLDMAGTTIKDENKVTETFSKAFLKFGYMIPDESINPLMGYKKNVAIAKMLAQYEPDADKITPIFIEAIHQEFIRLMIDYYRQTAVLESLPNAESTMKTLRAAGIKVGINTGFSKDIAETLVARLQWREKGLIDFLIGSDEVAEGRPDPEMIYTLMQLAGIADPQAVAKIGDTEVDIREGQNAGCKFVIAVTTGTFTRQELEPYHPTHIVDNIANILDIIRL